MAKDLYENFTEARDSYEKAGEILGFDLAKISFEGPEEKLKQTQATQPAIFVHSAVLIDRFIKSEFKPDVVAGHSLGEYSALYTARALTFEDALRLVKVRAELMQKAGEIQPGAMSAVIGLDGNSLTKICVDASSEGVVQIANYNSPSQIVISGSVNGVNRAMEMAKEAGAKRVIPLVVGGAFHSSLMDYAIEGFSTALEEVEIRSAEIPVYTNVTAQPVTDAAQIKKLLLTQLTSPVRWVEIIENMIEDSVTEFYELGPGSVLTGLLRRINRDFRGTVISNLENLEKLSLTDV